MSSFSNFVCFPFYLDIAQSASPNLSYDLSRTHSNRKRLPNLRRVRENAGGISLGYMDFYFHLI